MPMQSPDEKYEKRIEKLKMDLHALAKRNEELQKQENRFLSIFNSMDEIYFECDLAGNLTLVNPALCRISGYAPEELLGKNNREYTHPEMSKRMFQIFSQIYRTGNPAQIIDYEVYTKDGIPIFFELSAYLIKDEEENAVGFRGLGRNVTQRIKTERELRDSEERFRRLNEASFSGILIHDNAVIIDCNAELLKMTGYESADLIGKSGLDMLCAPESRNKLMAMIQSEEEKPYDIMAMKRNGTKFPVEIRGKKIPYHGKQVRIAEIRDITDRKKAEEALKKSRLRYRQLYKEAHKSEELYQSLLNSSADAVVLLDVDQNIQFINSTFTKVFGWKLEELQPKIISYIPKPLRESYFELISKVIEEGIQLQGYETQRYSKDGRLLDVSISASRYLDHTGDPAGVLITLRDISEAKKFLWHMHQAQKMESLGTLAGGVAHDFNNLLMGIQGRLSLLMLNMDHEDPNYNHLKDIEDYIIRAADLTRQLLGIARSGKYEVTPTDMNELIRKHNRMFGRTRKEISIHENLDDSLMTVEVDQRQIEQVLLNMYVNASHAMPRGGDLYIRTQHEKLHQTRTEPYELKPGTYVKISITDTGIGMDEATQKKVFEPFFTTKKRDRGTGLGLASAYGIIKNHGGFITLYSEVGRGTTFNVYLPASGKAPVEEKTISEEIVEGEGTILLVDDEEMILTVAEEMVKALGYNAITAKGASLAIDTFRENHEKISMVILDLIMPGMGGGEVFDKLRQIDPKAKILLASGYSINGEASSIMNRGCKGFIQKPFNIQELSKKINEVLTVT
jgi:two-component system, cell cycle sensor histidine kinase and response regulator CckA